MALFSAPVYESFLSLNYITRLNRYRHNIPLQQSAGNFNHQRPSSLKIDPSDRLRQLFLQKYLPSLTNAGE